MTCTLIPTLGFVGLNPVYVTVATRQKRSSIYIPVVLANQNEYSYFSYMKEAKISEVKNQLSRYLDLVRSQGEVIRILDRDVPVAQIVPITAKAQGRSAGTEALLTLERKGFIRRGTGVLDREILETDPPGKPCGVLQALLEERNAR